MRSAEKTEKKSHRTVSARSLANLRPYKPGKEWTGNAGGRPKSRLQSEAYRAELAKENKAGETNAELIAKQIVAQAKKGKVQAAEHIANYVEGKPRQAFEQTGPGGGAVQHVVTFVDGDGKPSS